MIVKLLFTCTYMYLLSSITAVSSYPEPPPNTIIQSMVGVILHTDIE